MKNTKPLEDWKPLTPEELKSWPKRPFRRSEIALWRNGRLPDDEINACFLWELSRELADMVRLIETWRGMMPREPLSNVEATMRIMPDQLNAIHISLSHWLPFQMEWPRIPWLELPDARRKELKGNKLAGDTAVGMFHIRMAHHFETKQCLPPWQEAAIVIFDWRLYGTKGFRKQLKQQADQRFQEWKKLQGEPNESFRGTTPREVLSTLCAYRALKVFDLPPNKQEEPDYGYGSPKSLDAAVRKFSSNHLPNFRQQFCGHR